VYAIVHTGGRQFRMEQDATVRIPKLEAEIGQTLELDRVLMIQGKSGTTVGTPTVAGAKVVAEVLEQGREKKIVVFKKKKRKRYTRKAGHRQPFTTVRVKEIVG
jgi:large subunit ribosomal protein L21